MNELEIALSERLRKACLEKGITEPRYVAQDADGEWYHFTEKPQALRSLWRCGIGSTFLYYDRHNPSWRETLMEWNPNAGVPLSEILKNTCEHCGKMIDGSDEIS